MRCALSAIHQYRDLMLVGDADDFLHGIHRSQHIADMSDRDDARPLAEQFLVLVQSKLAFIRDGYHAQTNPFAGLKQLPGDDVAVMLHFAEDNLIAFLHELLTIATGHQIDAFCGATRENNLAR